MLSNFRSWVIKFIDSKKEFPVIAAIASGLYPLLYYYNLNFTLINSWSQFFFFLVVFLVAPVIIFYSLYLTFIKVAILHKFRPYVIPVLSLCFFAFYIVVISYGPKRNILILTLLIAFILGVLLNKHIKKIIVFQFVLAAFVCAKLVPDLYKHLTYSSTWMQQPDTIEDVVFKKRPNVYVIQPDGYANFSELGGNNYNFDNSIFESFLTQNNFTLYQNFRSNYFSTLSSNSSMFSMKHHYYNAPNKWTNELYNARDIIVGKNPVVSIFNKNNYKTHLILETPYLLVNRPKLGYDYCNIDYSEISYFARGFEVEKDVTADLELAMTTNSATNNFYFIEKISPGHISTYNSASLGKEEARLDYLKKVQYANVWLTDLIAKIEKRDKNCLIIIVADHGGFVGMDYTLQSKEKQTERDLVYTIFTSALAIKWPDQAPNFDTELKSNVNLFRILFSYLSENDYYLENQQDNKSYTVIDKGAPFGVYELINENGEVVFNKH